MYSPVQEYERLFPQKDEECIAEFGDFGKHEERCPEARYSVVRDKTEIAFSKLSFLKNCLIEIEALV